MKVNKQQIRAITDKLEHGEKKKLAAFLGISSQALSRHLSTGIISRARYSKALLFDPSKSVKSINEETD
jgi:hypothetical protein